ncbi:MAG: acyltransferase [Bdellovibrionales bacterium]|nr:acyltransferase [Bdellovibrionales bacterium]
MSQFTSNNHLSYRTEIDGLRALSILGVLFFHLNKNLLPGGFVGVDVFFVISGYLITSGIEKNIQNHTFSFAHFYIRRIRRIFPALFACVIFTLILGAWVLMPEEFSYLAQASQYTSLQISNFFFFKQLNYFQEGYNTSSLLHTWSLGIEEQFYLLWPLLLFVLYRTCKPSLKFYVLLVILLTSFGASIWVTKDAPRAAFYLLPMRLWELMMGGLLVFPKISTLRARLSPVLLDLVNLLGVGFILVSFFFITPEGFPGYKAAIPCLGACFVIFANTQATTRSAKILMLQPLPFLGKISYSLYLLHWPIIIFYRIGFLRENLAPFEYVLLSAVCILFAHASWRWIENPFRKHQSLQDENLFLVSFQQKQKNKTSSFAIHTVFVWALAVSLCLVAVAHQIKSNNGWSWRLTFEPKEDELRYVKNSYCRFSDENDPFEKKRKCITGKKDAPVTVGLFGDSHAGHYFEATKMWADQHQQSMFFAFANRCPAVLGDLFVIDRTIENKEKAAQDFLQNNIDQEELSCRTYRERILQEIKQDQLQYIFLASRVDYFGATDASVFVIDQDNFDLTLETSQKVYMEHFEQTVKKLSTLGKHVIILGQVPFFDRNAMNYFRLPVYRLTRGFIEKEVALDPIEERLSPYISFYQNLTNKYPNVSFFNPIDVLCKDKTCQYRTHNKSLYQNGDHLNIYGSKFVGETLKKENF